MIKILHVFFYKQVSAPWSGSCMLKVSENPGSEYAYYMLKNWLFSYIVVDELRLLKLLRNYFLECKTVIAPGWGGFYSFVRYGEMVWDFFVFQFFHPYLCLNISFYYLSVREKNIDGTLLFYLFLLKKKKCWSIGKIVFIVFISFVKMSVKN